MRKMKFEFIKMLPHHVSGIKATRKSPHFPWLRREVLVVGL